MPKRTGRPWQRIKAQVIKRDGGICHLCGEPGADSADHVIPAMLLTEAQWYDPNNLRAVHHNRGRRCNRKRGAGDITKTRERLHADSTTGGWNW